MQIVPSTLLALVIAVALFLRGPVRGLWILLVATPFGAAAAFNLPAAGGATIAVLDLAAIAALVAVFLVPGAPERMAGTLRAFQPGFWFLLLLVFAVVSGLFFPRIFAGQTEVFSLSRAANERGIVSLPLRPTTGNLTQSFRLCLGAIAFLAVATAFRMRPNVAPVILALTVATVVNAVLGVLDVATFFTGTQALLEPIRTANYAILDNHVMMGVKRMIGGFPEASSFGNYTLGLFAFWLALWVHGVAMRRAMWMMALSGAVLLHSTSSSSYVALVVFLIAFGLTQAVRNTRAHVGRRGLAALFVGLLAMWIAAVAVFSAYALVDPVTAFLDRALFDKFETSSGVERMSWNAQAMQNFMDTFGIGAGLGAVRASSWLAASLGSLGLIGTLVYMAFLASLAAAPSRTGDAERDGVIRALKAACLALFLQALMVAPTPVLDITFFVFAGLIAGLSRGGVLAQRTQRMQTWRSETRSTMVSSRTRVRRPV